MSTFITPEHYREIKSRYLRFNEPWSEEETADLVEIFNCDFTMQEMANHLGRTPNSVRMKLKALGLYTPKPAPRPWTEKDDDLLVKMYMEDYSFEELSVFFGRSQNAIVTRLVRLRAGLHAAKS